MIIHPSLLQLTFQIKNIDVHYCPCASNVNHFFLSRDFHKKYLVVIHTNTLRIDIWVTHMCISTPASWITNVTEALFVAPFFESENAFTFRRTFHPIWLLLDGPPYEFARMAPPVHAAVRRNFKNSRLVQSITDDCAFSPFSPHRGLG